MKNYHKRELEPKMRVMTFLLLVTILAAITVKADTADQAQKEKATFVKEGKSVEKPAAINEDQNIKSFKLRKDGPARIRMSKSREMMGSAATSGPPCKLEKIRVMEKPSRSDIQKFLDQPQKVKRQKNEK
jgi:hypothetical protein